MSTPTDADSAGGPETSDSGPAEQARPSRRSASVADVRAGGQPPGLKQRRNEEHWAGRLYMRSLSPYFTWVFLRVGFSPNQLTYLMIACGIGAGVVAGLWSGLAGAIVTAVLVQLYLLLDCSDGEAARFTGQTSVAGVYLDRLGHYFSEVSLLIGLGFRAQGALTNGGWVELGLIGALGAALIKAETDNVVVARAKSGLPAEPASGDRAARPRSTGLALARQAAAALRFHRIIGAVELSLLILVAGVIDMLAGGLTATRVLAVAVALVAGVQTVLHFVSIVASRRLK
ncbi:CDP-alcohol phosphatidyltransferase family protein [Actinomadura scrupuli]|uniref:CDP-alcohol phosphatidyltransferase family protein n=1 Tax=Actinomadura scrupuli TaxID=559629 RepID=UPI003D98365D